MKVLHITNNYPTPNLPIFGIFVKEQIDSLSQINIDSEVFFINGKEKGKFEYVKGIFRLKNHLKENSYDVVHCHHVFSSIIFILTGFHRKIKSVVSFQNDPTEESKFNLFNLIKNKVDFWIFKNNSAFADEIRGFYLPNGVNTEFFQPIEQQTAKLKLGLSLDKKYILFVSSNQLRKQKRYDIFKATVEQLKKEDSSVEELKMINVHRDLVPYYFNAASLHLLTSDFEGSPNSVKEAMSCNIPVVSTDVGNVRDLFTNVEGCLIVDQDVEKLTAASLMVLNNQKTNARQSIIDRKLDINSVAFRLLKLYEDLLVNASVKR